MFAIVLALSLYQSQTVSIPPPGLPSGLWLGGYYVAGSESTMPLSEIDFAPLTHAIYFDLLPNSDGVLDMKAGPITDDNANAFRQIVHAANRKVLVCVGGAGSGANYEKAISPSNRERFVSDLVAWVDAHGYDGLDVDMEPVQPSDIPDFQLFVKLLHSALKSKNAAWMLTTAVNKDELAAYTDIQDQFDQINIMTYDMSGAWEGWETWYNGPLYDGGKSFQSNGKPLPSVDDAVKQWQTAGFSKSKLGIGIAFYGYVWHGADGPNQPIAGVKTETETYTDIMQKLFQPGSYHWDDAAKAPYLGIDQPAKEFVSYDDDKLCAAKIQYVKANGLGGAIIWQLPDAFFANNPMGQRNPLLHAIWQAEQ